MARGLHLFGLGYGPVAHCCDHDEVFLIDNTNKSPHIEMYSLKYNSERIVCESVHFNIIACVGTDCQLFTDARIWWVILGAVNLSDLRTLFRGVI
jgi:hypothetical protein